MYILWCGSFGLQWCVQSILALRMRQYYLLWCDAGVHAMGLPDREWRLAWQGGVLPGSSLSVLSRSVLMALVGRSFAGRSNPTNRPSVATSVRVISSVRQGTSSFSRKRVHQRYFSLLYNPTESSFDGYSIQEVSAGFVSLLLPCWHMPDFCWSDRISALLGGRYRAYTDSSALTREHALIFLSVVY